MKKYVYCMLTGIIITLFFVSALAEVVDADLTETVISEYKEYYIGDGEEIDVSGNGDYLFREESSSDEYNGDLIPINKETFPDKVFREEILDDIDYDGDKMLSEREIKNTKEIFLSAQIGKKGNLKSLVGIEYFHNLRILYCERQKLKKLDVSKNTMLQELFCSNNMLTDLDVSKNTKLEWLSCDDNGLKSLNLGKLKKLEFLGAMGNKLVVLDIGGCKKLLKNMDDLYFDYGETTLMKGKTVIYLRMPDYKYVPYKDIARNPDAYKGKKIYFDGKIVQVIEKGENITFRIDTGKNVEEVVWCTYKKPNNYKRFLEGDGVRIYGVSTGLHTYTSILGVRITIPSCSVDRIEFSYYYL